MSLHPAGTVIEHRTGERRILTHYDPGDDSYAAIDNFGAAVGRLDKTWIDGDTISPDQFSEDAPWRVVARPDWRPEQLHSQMRSEALGWAVNSVHNVLAVDGKPGTDEILARAAAFYGFIAGADTP